MTHMKTIVTSTLATNGSSNIVDGVQRDHNYFIDRVLEPVLYQQLKDRVAAMIGNTAGFADFRPRPPGTATLLAPSNAAGGVSLTPVLRWSDASWATNYDVWLGTSPSALTLVASRQASTQLYVGTALRPLTTYYWSIRARTNATLRDSSLMTSSAVWTFTTGATTTNAPPKITLTAPASGSTYVAPATLTLTASASDADGTITRVEFFRNTSSMCIVPAAPFTCTWSGVPSGAYTLTAVATDNGGAKSTSNASTITVGGSDDIVLYAARAAVRVGSWTVVPDASAAGGSRIHDPDVSSPKVLTAAASPANYFELRFTAAAGRPYRLWMRGKADRDSYENDSVWVQFSSARNASGDAAWRIGSSQGISLSVEQCSGCGLAGWGWHDNGWGLNVRGEPVYFATSGEQTIRIQRRQDGISIDQIVLSPQIYFVNAPGSAKNDATILAMRGQITSP
jgi:hypothetical protein